MTRTLREEVEAILSPAIDVRAPYAKCMVDALVRLLDAHQEQHDAGVVRVCPDCDIAGCSCLRRPKQERRVSEVVVEHIATMAKGIEEHAASIHRALSALNQDKGGVNG
jgi:hypothetical protein